MLAYTERASERENNFEEKVDTEYKKLSLKFKTVFDIQVNKLPLEFNKV